MRPPASAQSSKGRWFGAVVPDEFEVWRPPEASRDDRTPPPRRRRPRSPGIASKPVWGRIPDADIEEVARQAADRRAARFAARQRFLGRVRLSAPRKPRALDSLREVSGGAKLVALALMLALVAAVVLFALPWLKVQRVEVAGRSLVPPQQLLADAGARRGESTLLVDTAAMSRNLLAQPWVQSAAVRVIWPQTLVLSVTPLPPVLRYQRGSGQQLVAATGATLGPGQGIPLITLPLLVDQRSLGSSGVGAVVLPGRLTRALVALSRVFQATYGVGVSRYLITSIGALEIESTAGWKADLGLALTGPQISSIGPKLEALRALAGQVNLKAGSIKVIYLEDPSQVAVSY